MSRCVRLAAIYVVAAASIARLPTSLASCAHSARELCAIVGCDRPNSAHSKRVERAVSVRVLPTNRWINCARLANQLACSAELNQLTQLIALNRSQLLALAT